MKKVKLKDGEIVDIVELPFYEDCEDALNISMMFVKLTEILVNKKILTAINLEELLSMEPGQIQIVDDIDEPDPIRKKKEKL